MLCSTAFKLSSRAAAGLVAAVVLAGPTQGATPMQAPGHAMPSCAARAELKGVLESRYAERQAALGLAQDGRVLEVFVAPDGLTWTLLVTTKEGVSCILASGRSWLQHGPPKPGLDAGWSP